MFSRWAPRALLRPAQQRPLASLAPTRPITTSAAPPRPITFADPKQPHQRVSVVRDWTLERDQYAGKPYPCNVTAYPENRVWLGYVVLRLPRHRHFCDDKVDVFIEFSREGTRHPRCFATQAGPEDPASRLALRVRGEMLDAGAYNDYVFSKGRSVLFKANALADMLLDTASREEIMQRPRRSWQAKKAKRAALV